MQSYSVELNVVFARNGQLRQPDFPKDVIENRLLVLLHEPSSNLTVAGAINYIKLTVIIYWMGISGWVPSREDNS